MAVRIMVLLAMIAGAAVAAYGLFVDKSGQQVAFATAGRADPSSTGLLAGLLLALGLLAGATRVRRRVG